MTEQLYKIERRRADFGDMTAHNGTGGCFGVLVPVPAPHTLAWAMGEMVSNPRAGEGAGMKPKTIAELQERIREMQRRIDSQAALIHRYGMDRMQLALLAATGPTFNNPLAAMKAETLRDRILEDMGMNPDGTLMGVANG